MSTGDSAGTHVDEIAQVTDNAITDSGNLSLEDILNGGLVNTGDVASNNNVLNGIISFRHGSSRSYFYSRGITGMNGYS